MRVRKIIKDADFTFCRGKCGNGFQMKRKSQATRSRRNAYSLFWCFACSKTCSFRVNIDNWGSFSSRSRKSRISGRRFRSESGLPVLKSFAGRSERAGSFKSGSNASRVRLGWEINGDSMSRINFGMSLWMWVFSKSVLEEEGVVSDGAGLTWGFFDNASSSFHVFFKIFSIKNQE